MFQCWIRRKITTCKNTFFHQRHMLVKICPDTSYCMHSQILPVHAILQLHFDVPSNTACSACSMSSAWDGPLVSLKEVLLILGMYDSSVWHRIRYNKYQQRLRTVKQRWGSRKRMNVDDAVYWQHQM